MALRGISAAEYGSVKISSLGQSRTSANTAVLSTVVDAKTELTHMLTQTEPPPNLKKLIKGNGSRGTDWVIDNSATGGSGFNQR